MRIQITSLLLLALAPILSLAQNGTGTLSTNSVSYCAEAKAVIVDALDITYHQSNQSATFVFSLQAVEDDLNVSANLYLNAYGMQIVNQTFDLCSYFQGVICPLPTVNFTGYGTLPIPANFVDQLPGIAFTVPNLEAYARLELVRSGTNEVAACLQATLTNGHTTRHFAVAIATAIFTLVALLVGLWHAAAVNSPSPAQYRWFDILYLFQTAAASGLLHLNYPLVYSNFAANFSWALGLFHSNSMQNSINTMRVKTGGTLSGSAYSDIQYVNRRLSPYNLLVNVNQLGELLGMKSFLASVPRLDARGIEPRADISSVYSSDATSEIDTGIPVYTNTFNIPEANAYSTIFFFFLAFIGIALVFHLLLFVVVLVADRSGRALWATRLRKVWWGFCTGNALRVCLIWFIPIWIFGFYQFYLGDSGLAIFFGVFGILLTLVPLGVAFLLSLRRHRRASSTSPTISPLYTSFRWFHSVGALYRPYRQRFHFFWFAPLVLAMIARAGFIAFGNPSPWAQVIGNIVIEFIVFVLLIACRPHKDRKGDWLAPFLCFCRMAAFGLLIAFIPSMNVDAIPRTIIGLVIVVCFGIPTILLFFGLLWNIGYGYLWRRHAHRIEDGLEIERFVVDDDDSQTRPAMVESNRGSSSNHFLGGAAFASRNADSPSLGRRTSVIEPVENTYEPSNARYSNTHNGYGYDNSPISPTYGAPADHQRHSQAAYADAANGRHGMMSEKPRSGTPGGLSTRTNSNNTMYFTPGVGDEPANDQQRWSRDQYFNKQQ